MARLGFRTFDEMIGQSDRIDTRRAVSHWKARGLDFSRILHKPDTEPGVAIRNTEIQDHELEKALDRKLIEEAQPALEHREPVFIETNVYNTNRTVGAMLSGEIATRYGHAGLETDTIRVRMKGTAGQSFGAWLARGVTLELEGDANDYVGKGLSGGRIIIVAPPYGPLIPHENVIIGNTVLYGAISGECYFNGGAGERFAVRNSGAVAVVERVGDHGCEYMTGGCVVVLGTTGRNFAAGMSGGIAYVVDESGDLSRRCNLAMVELEAIDPNGGPPPGVGVDPTIEELMAEPLRHDAWRLRTLLERHARFVDSSRAREILDGFDKYLPQFVKVVPIEYRRALEEPRRLDEGAR
jgi:glutamate synthase (NADPH/NADH) large chain